MHGLREVRLDLPRAGHHSGRLQERSLNPVVTVPFELDASALTEGTPMDLVDREGAHLGRGVLLRTREAPGGVKTVLLRIRTSPDVAARVAGVRIQDESVAYPEPAPRTLPLQDDAIVCRCERVTAGAIRRHLREGSGTSTSLRR